MFLRGTIPLIILSAQVIRGLPYLYKLLNNYIIAFDTMTFTYLGYFSFPHLLAGDYFVKVLLTPAL